MVDCGSLYFIGELYNCTNVHGMFCIRFWRGIVLRGDGECAYRVGCYAVWGRDIISSDVVCFLLSGLRDGVI